MARTASGAAVFQEAKRCLAKARTVGELRQAQAVILPLEFGFSMDQVSTTHEVSIIDFPVLVKRLLKLPAPFDPLKVGGAMLEPHPASVYAVPFFSR